MHLALEIYFSICLLKVQRLYIFTQPHFATRNEIRRQIDKKLSRRKKKLRKMKNENFIGKSFGKMDLLTNSNTFTKGYRPKRDRPRSNCISFESQKQKKKSRFKNEFFFGQGGDRTSRGEEKRIPTAKVYLRSIRRLRR